MIRTNDLRKEFNRGIVALDNINTKIRDQEFIALLGPPGCGKPTTLNCIAELLDIASGEILFDEENVTEKAPKSHNISVVFQSYALYLHLKVINNIVFPLRQEGVGEEERHQKAKEMAKKLQIKHLLGKRPTRLSGGWQQRVVICRALVREPRILLPDEPMSNLDTRLKVEIREMIRIIQQELRVTSVIVTHDQEEVMAIADQIAILDNGNVQQYDTPDTLHEYPADPFVASFIGNPPINLVDAVIEKQDDGCAHVIGDRQIPVSGVMGERMEMHAGKKVKLGVRSYQTMVEREPSHGTLLVKVQMTEDLGRELLATGDIGENHTRITLDNTSRLQELKEEVIRDGVLYIRLTDKINIFDGETKMNLVL